jgi:transposase
MRPPDLLTMSAIELDRLTVIERVRDRRLSQVDAAKQLGLTPRHISRLVNAFERDGPAALVSKRRGRRSNHACADAVKTRVLSLVREHYADFGPTLIAEKLAEKHELDLSRETLRLWLMEAGLWQSRKQRDKAVHQPSNRRHCLGELIQIDGSEHAWFEARGPKCTLLVYVDDATGRLMELRFVDSETTFDYFHATRRYLELHGKPVAFYSDKHSVFRVNQAGATGGIGLTQFGRALHELNIDILYANSSQAKGRVERMNKTLQDRLVKELRLESIDTLEDANVFLPGFMDRFNEKFAREPASDKDLHRPLTELDDLDEVLCWQEERTVSNSLTVQYDRVVYLLEPNEVTVGLRRKKVRIHDYPDGTIAIKYDGADLPYSVFDKVRQVKQADIVSNKRLGAVLKHVQEEQQIQAVERSKKAPTRRGQRRLAAERFRDANPAVG